MAKTAWLTARLPEPYYLPTPSFGINRALGGRGLSSGRIHLYWGPKASGKTTACFQQIAKAQQEGKVCAFIDSERAFTPEWAEKNGVDLDTLLYYRANSAEEILNVLIPDLASEKIDVVVIDSLSSIAMESFFEKNESNAMGTMSRSSKFFTQKVLNALGMDQQIIIISHASMAKEGQHFVQRASIGSAIDHWTSTQIKFRKVGGKDGIRESDGAMLVKWKIEKSKQSVYPVEGEYWFNPNTATIDYVSEVFDAAVMDEVIDKSGAWFYYHKGEDDEQKWHGGDAVVEQLRYDLLLRQDLERELIDLGVKKLEEDDDEQD